MKNIKSKWTDLLWLRIGYTNWLYYKDRKQLCYKGKHITFDYNKGLFNAVLIMIKCMEEKNGNT